MYLQTRMDWHHTDLSDEFPTHIKHLLTYGHDFDDVDDSMPSPELKLLDERYMTSY